ncbi:MAG: stress response translation initiation inhibitor YciH [Calditrichia bacterium]
MKKKGKLVYSTEPGWENKYCSDCGKLKEDCRCSTASESNTKSNTIYIERSVKGRGGKTVTIVTGLSDLKMWKKRLQQICASGGTIKGSDIEIQGDHRQKIKQFLEKESFKVKLKGG